MYCNCVTVVSSVDHQCWTVLSPTSVHSRITPPKVPDSWPWRQPWCYRQEAAIVSSSYLCCSRFILVPFWLTSWKTALFFTLTMSLLVFQWIVNKSNHSGTPCKVSRLTGRFRSPALNLPIWCVWRRGIMIQAGTLHVTRDTRPCWERTHLLSIGVFGYRDAPISKITQSWI